MRNELKHIEEIENYLLGKFSKEEKSDFELKMQTDSSLRSEVELQKNITERIALAGFITDVKNYHNEWVVSSAASTGSGNWKWIMNTILAIFLTGLTAVAVHYTLKDKDEKNENNSTGINNEDTSSVKHGQTLKRSRLLSGQHDVSKKTVGFIPNYPDVKTPANKNASASSLGNSKPKNKVPNVIEPTYVEPTKDVLDRLQVPFEEITMDAQEGKTFNTKVSGTRIIFPAGILQHEDGSKVEGEVTIRYREFRNAAEMAFSGIPMEHEQDGEKFQMNSNGMIEIRAVQNGEELKIGKNTFFTIDMEVTDNLDDSYFWSMDDETKKWKCLDTLQYGNPNPEVKEMEEENKFGMLTGKIFDALTGDTIYYAKIKLTPVGDIGQSVSSAYYNDTGFVMPKINPGKYNATISLDGYNSYTFENIDLTKGQYRILEIHLKPKKQYHHLYSSVIYDLFNKNSHNRKLKDVKAHATLNGFDDIPSELQGEFAMIASTSKMIYEEAGLNMSRKDRKKLQIDALSRETKPKFIVAQKATKDEVKNNFNNTVFGLQCAGFGVYNCDQITRMKNPVNVRPMFGGMTDLPDNNTNKQMVVIDKNMNSVFNFNSTVFSCSTEGKNTLLIYYQGKIYGMTESEFAAMKINKSGNYDFKMTDITDQLHSTDDLKKYLGL